MSFLKYNNKIKEGDTVIIHLSHKSMFPAVIQKGKTLNMQYGVLKHDNIIDKTFGSKIECSKGYIRVLHPTAELWTVTLPHRTQILYTTDISMIVMQLDLKPGCVVLESGTGSGSLSHALIRAIAPTGHLHTFEFHQQRSEKADEEFISHRVKDMVTVYHKDVCSDGFGLTDMAHAVFLDLPHPWDAIPHAKQALKSSGGRICSFSPCIEQVQKSCSTLKECGFSDLETMESLLRTYNVSTTKIPLADLGEHEEDLEEDTEEDTTDTITEDEKPPKKVKMEDEANNKMADQSKKQSETPSVIFNTTQPAETVQAGHTGFLTFATLYPR